MLAQQTHVTVIKPYSRFNGSVLGRFDETQNCSFADAIYFCNSVLFHNQIIKGEKIMQDMHFTPLNEKDRKRNLYLDQMNHAPYSTIFFVMLGLLLLFTIGTLAAAF